MSLSKRLYNWERKIRAHYNVDLSTPENRRRAEIYNKWFDHAVLRGVWKNFHNIAPGVYRSNQPTHARFVKIREMGITTILNLRGESTAAHYLVEKETCDALGFKLVSATLHARAAASRAEIQGVLAAFRQVDKPVMIHCKSGADRAGFASAMWLMVMEGMDVAEARKMLSTKYAHLKWTRTGVLDYILRTYQARTQRSPISFEDWIALEYDPKTLQDGFDNKVKIT